jgi:hypothetical protein
LKSTENSAFFNTHHVGVGVILKEKYLPLCAAANFCGKTLTPGVDNNFFILAFLLV